MRQVLPQVESIAEEAREAFARKNRAREAALGRCRDAIRLSANGIRAVHREDFGGAKELIDRAGVLLQEARAALSGDQDIYHAGFIHDAQKEYAEARITLAIIDPAGRVLPRPEELEVELSAYLNGMAEAVGELRRHLLDAIRLDSTVHALECLEVMDEIYGILVTFDYPDAMTGGLRRMTDNVRGILERSRGDLTVAVRQADLERSLKEFGERLNASRDA